jgi:hypothetical protein
MDQRMTLRDQRISQDAQVSNLWIPGLREALLLQAAPRQEALRLEEAKADTLGTVEAKSQI